MLRLEAGRHPDDRRLADLIGELTVRLPEFATWWNDRRVLRRTHGTKRYLHPVAGELEFSYESFHPPGDPAGPFVRSPYGYSAAGPVSMGREGSAVHSLSEPS